MRQIAALLLACLSSASLAAPDPRTVQSKLDAKWQARTRALFEQVIEIPTVINRGEVPRMANLLADQFRAAGIPEQDIRIIPYEGLPGDKTAALVVRWRSPHAIKKPMLLIGHMDVVEAKREDWKYDPFLFREEGGYFYGRGTNDMKNGIVAMTMAVAKLKAQAFRPDRDVILFFTGDEETKQNGALKGTTEWRNLLESEFALNADGGGGAFDHDGRPLGYSIIAAEKTFQTYFLTARNPGGHSSRPRPDNAIYDLADALKKLQGHRFTPQLNPTSRAYFTERQKDEQGTLGDAMRRWLANESDQEAADIIEADPLESGTTRTRCVATMLQGGHADNALPQSAAATVNCRIMPGAQPTDVQAELQGLVGQNIEVRPDPNFIGRPTPVMPLRADVLKAYADAVRAIRGPGQRIIPTMAVGTSDSSFFRAAGIPTYHVDGQWGISPDDDRSHGLDERTPVGAMYDDVLHWEIMIRDLASK
jgi:acetylornithine deacetylase/succinyl-diaminopimelate desuccinylase-like protein